MFNITICKFPLTKSVLEDAWFKIEYIKRDYPEDGNRVNRKANEEFLFNKRKKFKSHR